MSAPVSEQNHNERHAVDDVTCVPLRSRRRRDRTQFTTNDVLRLEDYFFIDRYPDIHAREQLAEELAVSEDRIQVWFQNRRSKQRRLAAFNRQSTTQRSMLPHTTLSRDYKDSALTYHDSGATTARQSFLHVTSHRQPMNRMQRTSLPNAADHRDVAVKQHSEARSRASAPPVATVTRPPASAAPAASADTDAKKEEHAPVFIRPWETPNVKTVPAKNRQHFEFRPIACMTSNAREKVLVNRSNNVQDITADSQSK